MLYSIKKSVSRFYHCSRAVAVIEVALTIPIFLAVFGAFLELARLSILSAYVDSTLSLAVREVKNSPNITGEASADKIKEKLDDTRNDWAWLNNGRFDVSANFYDSVDDVIKKRSVATPNSANWAEYHIQYHYNPMFTWLPKTMVGNLMQRNILVLLEHQK